MQNVQKPELIATIPESFYISMINLYIVYNTYLNI